MVELLAKLFLKDTSDVKNAKVRQGYARICCMVGIMLNVLLFAGKYVAGLISGSVAIMADSFNNLSDAGSSVITLIGFQMAGKKADTEHPFGHGRVEYISGLAVAAMILIMGVELFRTSIGKIIHPEAVDTSPVAFLVLIISIFVKLYMASYNTKIGKKINSAAMKATATDSLSDTLATTVVLLSMLIMKFTGWNVDGICGLFVAVFIIRAGFEAARDTLSPLLGQAPGEEFVEQIKKIVMSYDKVCGMHDLIVHDYGPGRCMISLHAEVSGDEDIYEIHDMIDTIEQQLQEELDCEAVIHMDPIDVNDKSVKEMREKVEALIKKKEEKLSIHDFRMVKGPTHTNVIFDLVIPLDVKMNETDAKKWVETLVRENFDHVFAVVKVEKSYI